MKIMFFINSLEVGGAERSTASLANALSERGFQVSITTFGVPVPDDFPLKSLVTRGHVNGFTSRNNFIKLINIFYIAFQFSKLIRTRSSHRYDVIVGVMTTASVLGILAGRFSRVKVITNERVFPGKAERGFAWRLLRTVLYRFADAHVVSTSTTASWMRNELNLLEVTVIPNSVSYLEYSGLPTVSPMSYGLGDDAFILAVGSSFHHKGFDLLLDSWVLVRRVYPNLKLVILGLRPGGREWFLLGRYVQELGLADSVITPGVVGNMDEWYKAANCFVLSSRYEGFANVLLEAMFYGCPPVSFNCQAGPNEIISHDIDGILVELGDVEALAKAIIRLVEDNALRSRLKASALLKSRNFTHSFCCVQWLRLFTRVIGRA